MEYKFKDGFFIGSVVSLGLLIITILSSFANHFDGIVLMIISIGLLIFILWYGISLKSNLEIERQKLMLKEIEYEEGNNFNKTLCEIINEVNRKSEEININDNL